MGNHLSTDDPKDFFTNFSEPLESILDRMETETPQQVAEEIKKLSLTSKEKLLTIVAMIHLRTLQSVELCIKNIELAKILSDLSIEDDGKVYVFKKVFTRYVNDHFEMMKSKDESLPSAILWGHLYNMDMASILVTLYRIISLSDVVRMQTKLLVTIKDKIMKTSTEKTDSESTKVIREIMKRVGVLHVTDNKTDNKTDYKIEVLSQGKACSGSSTIDSSITIYLCSKSSIVTASSSAESSTSQSSTTVVKQSSKSSRIVATPSNKTTTLPEPSTSKPSTSKPSTSKPSTSKPSTSKSSIIAATQSKKSSTTTTTSSSQSKTIAPDDSTTTKQKKSSTVLVDFHPKASTPSFICYDAALTKLKRPTLKHLQRILDLKFATSPSRGLQSILEDFTTFVVFIHCKPRPRFNLELFKICSIEDRQRCAKCLLDNAVNNSNNSEKLALVTKEIIAFQNEEMLKFILLLFKLCDEEINEMFTDKSWDEVDGLGIFLGNLYIENCTNHELVTKWLNTVYKMFMRTYTESDSVQSHLKDLKFIECLVKTLKIVLNYLEIDDIKTHKFYVLQIMRFNEMEKIPKEYRTWSCEVIGSRTLSDQDAVKKPTVKYAETEKISCEEINLRLRQAANGKMHPSSDFNNSFFCESLRNFKKITISLVFEAKEKTSTPCSEKALRSTITESLIRNYQMACTKQHYTSTELNRCATRVSNFIKELFELSVITESSIAKILVLLYSYAEPDREVSLLFLLEFIEVNETIIVNCKRSKILIKVLEDIQKVLMEECMVNSPKWIIKSVEKCYGITMISLWKQELKSAEMFQESDDELVNKAEESSRSFQAKTSSTAPNTSSQKATSLKNGNEASATEKRSMKSQKASLPKEPASQQPSFGTSSTPKREDSDHLSLFYNNKNLHNSVEAKKLIEFLNFTDESSIKAFANNFLELANESDNSAVFVKLARLFDAEFSTLQTKTRSIFKDNLRNVIPNLFYSAFSELNDNKQMNNRSKTLVKQCGEIYNLGWIKKEKLFKMLNKISGKNFKNFFELVNFHELLKTVSLELVKNCEIKKLKDYRDKVQKLKFKEKNKQKVVNETVEMLRDMILTCETNENVNRVKENVETLEAQEEDNEMSEVEEESVKTMEVQEENVETSEVQEKNVETSEVQEENVEMSEVQERSVETSEVQERSVETSEVQEENVVTSEVQEENVEMSEVQEGSVKTPEVQERSVETSEVQEENVKTSEVQERSVETSKVQERSVETSKVEDVKKPKKVDITSMFDDISIENALLELAENNLHSTSVSLCKIVGKNNGRFEEFMEVLWKFVVFHPNSSKPYTSLCSEIMQNYNNIPITGFNNFLQYKLNSLSSKSTVNQLEKIMTFIAELYRSNIASDETLELWFQLKLSKQLPSTTFESLRSIIEPKVSLSKNIRIRTLMESLEDHVHEKSMKTMKDIKSDLDDLLKIVSRFRK